jgi:serine acetyltransferase
MIQQFRYLFADYKRICGGRKGRLLYLWMSRIAIGIFIYRFERGMYLAFGKFWSAFRIIFTPLLNLFYAYSNCEINYHAQIGPGILILHTAPVLSYLENQLLEKI